MQVPIAPLFLGGPDVQDLLTAAACRDAVELAFLVHGTHRAPAPVVAGVPAPQGGFHWKAAWWPGPPPRFVGKLNANFPQNPARHGLPTIQGIVTLCDGETGALLALLDSGVLTALRTAAATAVAAGHLARADAEVLAIVGCGIQGRAHLPAIAGVRSLRRVLLVDHRREAADRLARECGKTLGIAAHVTDLAAALRAADMVVTCTPATEFLMLREQVRPGTFVAGVGADAAHKREIPPALLAAATLVVDVLEQAATMGDLHHAIASGHLARGDVYAELGAIVAGIRPGRTTAEEITIFDSTGMALQDAASAVAVYERAVMEGRGRVLALGGQAV